MTKNKLMKNALSSVKSSLPAFSLELDLRQESDLRLSDLRQWSGPKLNCLVLGMNVPITEKLA